jgi:uncharacterized protein YutE (UPF0331/DUF86 family)
MDDVILNKVATVKRCLVRINEEFTGEAEFKSNFTKQDSVVLNIQRACEACIDLANYLIKKNKLGIPQSARDSFDLLSKENIITVVQADSLKRMVGLRNIAVHDYQSLNLDIVIAVVTHHLSDFDAFCAEILNQT